ncbi:hypothetical protein ACK3TF_000837 [Chlorella vulgaris]
MLLRRALRFRRLLIAAARSTQGGGGPPLTPAVYSASAASARLNTRPAAWQSVSEKGSSASDPHVTSAVGSEATSATAAPAATIQGAELTAEDYQQLTPDEFAAVADVYIGGLWTRIERGLREAEGEEFDYEVKLEGGALLVSLPYDGLVVIRPCGEQCWVSEDEQSITEFLGSALTQYLKKDVKVSL